MAGLSAEACSVVTQTACEKDRFCQAFLQSLHPALRPEHVLSDLENHITEEARHDLDNARTSIVTGLAWKLRFLEKSEIFVF